MFFYDGRALPWARLGRSIVLILALVLGPRFTFAEDSFADIFPAQTIPAKCSTFLLGHHGPNFVVQRFGLEDTPRAKTMLWVVQDKNTFQYARSLPDNFVVTEGETIQQRLFFKLDGRLAVGILTAPDTPKARNVLRGLAQLVKEYRVYQGRTDLYRMTSVSLAILFGAVLGLHYPAWQEAIDALGAIGGGGLLSLYLQFTAAYKFNSLQKGVESTLDHLPIIADTAPAARPWRAMILIQDDGQRQALENQLLNAHFVAQYLAQDNAFDAQKLVDEIRPAVEDFIGPRELNNFPQPPPRSPQE